MSAILKQKLIDIANGFTKYGLWKGGGSSSLSEMTDVTLSNLQANDILKYNGSVWVNDDDLQKQINTLNSNLIKVEFIDIIVTTVADRNAIGGYYGFIGLIKPTKGKKIAIIPLGSVRTDKNGIGGVICKYHSRTSGIDVYTLNASAAAEYRCDFICLYTE